MQGQMRVIPPGGGAGTVTKYTGPMGINDLNAAVQGYIELVPYFNWVFDDTLHKHVQCRVFCNEYGKQHSLHFNLRATELWREALEHAYGQRGTPNGDYLVGNVAIVTGDDSFMADL